MIYEQKYTTQRIVYSKLTSSYRLGSNELSLADKHQFLHSVKLKVPLRLQKYEWRIVIKIYFVLL